MKLNTKPINVFIGYDSEETIAFHTCAQSIIEHSNNPIKIIPLKLSHFKKFYKRKKRKVDSTEFSISRFLVPYLSEFKGYSLYMDCDIIVNSNLNSLKKIIKKKKKKNCIVVRKT